jgi:hypothetical protein
MLAGGEEERRAAVAEVVDADRGREARGSEDPLKPLLQPHRLEGPAELVGEDEIARGVGLPGPEAEGRLSSSVAL